MTRDSGGWGYPLRTVRRPALLLLLLTMLTVVSTAAAGALISTGTRVPPGSDDVTSAGRDDGVRLWMEDERLVDRWTPRESKIDPVPVTGATRRFKLEYDEIGGFAELRFEILRR